MHKKLGLALGAGSARGLAHLGVLKVLEEHDIKVDYIAGSSAGSVVGGVYSVGTDIEMLMKLVPTLDIRRLFDATLPHSGGFLHGNKFYELIDILTKGRRFEETVIPFQCVAVDLVNGTLKTFSEPGMKIVEAIRASIAIPAVIEPYEIDQISYVDGAVICRVPSQTVADMGADVVVSVDVGYRGGKVFDGKMNIVDHIISATDIMGWEITKSTEQKDGILIAPDVRPYDPNSFKDFESIVQAGEKATREVIPQILAALE